MSTCLVGALDSGRSLRVGVVRDIEFRGCERTIPMASHREDNTDG